MPRVLKLGLSPDSVSLTPFSLSKRKFNLEILGAFCLKVHGHLVPGFLASALLTFGLDNSFPCRDCPLHCTMFSSTSGLYTLDASSTTTSIVTIKNVSTYSQMCSGGTAARKDAGRSVKSEFQINIFLVYYVQNIAWDSIAP